MFEFSDTHAVIESTLRKFCEEEIEPQCAALERGDVSPFEPLRSLAATFQLEELVGGPLRLKAQRLREGRGAYTLYRTVSRYSAVLSGREIVARLRQRNVTR